MDTGARKPGSAATRPVPFVPGVEAAGSVRELGAGVTDFAVGDRVTWVYAYGTYAEQIALPAAAAVPVPAGVSDEIAAAVMMQGLSAQHFATEAAPVQPGQTVLVHAAAGGLGQILVQLIKMRGGRVIGLVSREDKVEAARKAGADEVLVLAGDRFVHPVLHLTSGQGVDTVFDGGGETTFWASTRVARRHGTVLYYGVRGGDRPAASGQSAAAAEQHQDLLPDLRRPCAHARGAAGALGRVAHPGQGWPADHRDRRPLSAGAGGPGAPGSGVARDHRQAAVAALNREPRR
jgi:NADPH2:quinone reductase